ncbi:MAG: glycosidase, partial [Acidimicrobiales bacterium]
MTLEASRLARRSPVHIAADKSRVVTRLFVPGQEGFDHQESRSSAVLQRLLALRDDEVERSYEDVIARFNGRHRALTDTF